jgi:hypothetical protein
VIAAEDFARPTEGVGRTFHFGLDKQRALDTLAKFAAGIADGTFLVSEVKLTGTANNEDFTSNVLAIEYHIGKIAP